MWRGGGGAKCIPPRIADGNIAFRLPSGNKEEEEEKQAASNRGQTTGRKEKRETLKINQRTSSASTTTSTTTSNWEGTQRMPIFDSLGVLQPKRQEGLFQRGRKRIMESEVQRPFLPSADAVLLNALEDDDATLYIVLETRRETSMIVSRWRGGGKGRKEFYIGRQKFPFHSLLPSSFSSLSIPHYLSTFFPYYNMYYYVGSCFLPSVRRS